ncbi:hypothetical protein [Cochlodiniinecator piscidefendens]|uniref:hypothetical protein n=1 Tax=Cochlodiniinecator piscidefendens TaxID=2715756 RepID=UPI00140B4353|nr:hypothetical protein [Cochlodiniinecator piscidefendens]
MTPQDPSTDDALPPLTFEQDRIEVMLPWLDCDCTALPSLEVLLDRRPTERPLT